VTETPGRWPAVRLREIADPARRWALNGGPFGSNLTTRDYVPAGVPVIRGGNLSGGGRFSFESLVFVTEAKADELAANNAHPGDLVFTQRGTLGQIGLIPDNSPFPRFVISQSQMKLTPDLSAAEALFLYYYFAHPETVHTIQNLAIQAGVPHINLEVLREFEVPLPPLVVQRQIASILCAYDDLIENCVCRISVLDEMARALYREWFLRFLFPGHENIALMDSDIGKIPKGWRAERAGAIAIETRRSVPKGALESSARYVGLEHIPRRSLALGSWEETANLGSNKLAFARGEILFGKIRPYFHKVAVAPFDGVCSADTFVVSAREPLARSFLTCLLSSDAFVAHASATANGAKMPRANWPVMMDFPIAIPPEYLLRAFSSLIEPLIDDQRSLVLQIENLHKTRDLLLPRLMSGQLSVGSSP
jgi:type I restriction enzyme, S subunit